MVDGKEVDDVEEFTYLGAIVDKVGGGTKDILHRLQKAGGTFQRLGRVWAARGIERRTKIRLFKTLVQPVRLYGCETWKISTNNERKLNSFQCQSLRHITRVKWHQKMTKKNERVVQLVEINDISCEVRQRRWNWLGHILRREGENDCFTALGWTPEGRRVRGDQKLLGGGQSQKSETKLGGRAGK